MKDFDFDAWDVEEPPPGFADRVLAASQVEPTPSPARPAISRRRWVVLAGVVGAAAAAAGIFVTTRPGESSGEAFAEGRVVEVPVGERAIAVLSPGARVRWRRDEVTQERGDVFYRVDKGAGRFRVHTAVGDAEVKGTAFRVRVKPQETEPEMNKRDAAVFGVGAATAAVVLVGVYEGKVRVTHAKGSVDLGAGEAATSDAQGASKSSLEEGERAFERARAAASLAGEAPLLEANKNLADSVRSYKDRLQAIEGEKAQLEKQLSVAQERLAAQSDGAAPKAKNPFDLSSSDWAELAKTGSVKFQVPCMRGDKWTPSADLLNRLGLAPHDGPTLQAAYAGSAKRVWSEVKPLCAGLVGSADVAERLGMNSCTHVVIDLSREKDKEATEEAFREVGEIRAGLRPMPTEGAPVHPVLRMFLALTGEEARFEADLAQSLGPEEAHRLSFHPEMCMSKNSWGGPGPRTPN